MNIDYDSIECPSCNHVGVMPDGGFDYMCPMCGFEGSLCGDVEVEDEY
jgi:hypothetical protein